MTDQTPAPAADVTPNSVKDQIQSMITTLVIEEVKKIVPILETSIDRRFTAYFQSKELMDTFTANVLRNSYDAVMERAQQSTDNQEYTLVRNYLAGARRVVLRGDGVVQVEVQTQEDGEEVTAKSPWVEDEMMVHPQAVEAARTFLTTYGVEPDTVYYMLTRGELSRLTKEASAAMSAATAAPEDVAEDVTVEEVEQAQ